MAQVVLPGAVGLTTVVLSAASDSRPTANSPICALRFPPLGVPRGGKPYTCRQAH